MFGCGLLDTVVSQAQNPEIVEIYPGFASTSDREHEKTMYGALSPVTLRT